MDSNTLGWIVFITALGLSWIATHSAFFGLRLMAGAFWFVVFIYLKTNVPTAITEGSGLHTALLIVPVGFGLMLVLSGLGRGIARSRKWEQGEEQVTGGFKWQLPDWMKTGGENEYQRRQRDVEQDNLEYKRKLREAYRSGEYGKRGR